MYKYMYVCIHTHTHTQTHTRMLYVCMHVCMYMYTRARTHTHTHTQEVETKPAEDSEFNNALNTLDLVFTVFYVIELALNLFVNWWRPFFSNGWSVFDGLCVLSSVIGALLSEYGDGKIDLSVIRSIRIFKIVRIFSRLKALQRIVSAITTTLYPLLNTFIIFVVVVSIYSVLACQVDKTSVLTHV